VHIEPSLGALGFRIEPLHQAPEPRRMVQLHEMAHLVRGKVVEHEGRRENEAPGERQHARIGTRAPTARLITYVDALDRNAQRGRITAAGSPGVPPPPPAPKVACTGGTQTAPRRRAGA